MVFFTARHGYGLDVCTQYNCLDMSSTKSKIFTLKRRFLVPDSTLCKTHSYTETYERPRALPPPPIC